MARTSESLKVTSMAIPVPLWEWICKEAEASGRSRNSFVTCLLERARDNKIIERLERVERILDAHGIYE